MTPRRYFITGGLGFVGRRLARMLLAEQYQVTIFDNASQGRDPYLSRHKSCRVIYGDIRDAKMVQSSLKRSLPDVVIHLAAVHYIPYCISHAEETLQINLLGTQHVIDGVKTLPFRPLLIFTSSASVYGVAAPEEQREAAQPTPCDIYGYSKALGEHLIHTQLNNYAIVRLFNVAGRGDPHPHLLPRITEQLEPHGTIKLGNPSASRDFIHVDDVARGFIAISHKGHHKETYNLGGGKSYTVKEVVDLFMARYPYPLKAEFLTDRFRVTDPPVLRADTAKLQAHTGWRPLSSLETAIDELLATKKSLSPKQLAATKES